MKDIAIKVSPDKSLADANEEMGKKSVFLSIVVNNKDKPMGFFTTGDVRQSLLNLEV